MPKQPKSATPTTPEPIAEPTPAPAPVPVPASPVDRDYSDDNPWAEPKKAETAKSVTVTSSQAEPTPAPVPAPEPVTPAPVAHPQILVDMAKEYGAEDAEIGQASVAELERFIRIQRRRETQERQTSRPVAQASAPAPAPALEPVEEEVTLDPEFEQHFDETTVRLMKKVLGPAIKSNKALQAEVDRLKQAEQHRGHVSAMDSLDQRFTALNKDYGGALGEGHRDSLDPMGPELAKRNAIVQEGKRLASIAASQGKNPTFDQILARATANIMGLPSTTPAPVPAAPSPPPAATPAQVKPRDPLTGQYLKTADEWADAALATPAGREKAPLPAGNARFIQKYEELARANGIPVQPHNPDDQIKDW